MGRQMDRQGLSELHLSGHVLDISIVSSGNTNTE